MLELKYIYINNEDLTRKEPVNEGNNEGEIIPEESKLEILRENDLREVKVK